MKRYMRVHGIVYECTLVYARHERLDPLAELVYEGLRHERDIERLSRAFGLPATLVDNILVDLVRRGFAMLDIDRNQLLRVEHPSARPEHRESRSERIWYDLATGGIALERRVQGFARRPAESFEEVVLTTPPVGAPDFTAISDAQLIAQLVRLDPTLEWEEGRRWRLEHIKTRLRIGTRPLWLEIQGLKLFDEDVELIQEEDVPQWMTRSWTSTLARQRSIHAAPGPFAAAAVQPDADLLARASVSRTLDRWARSVDGVLTRSPRPVTTAEMTELAEVEAVLMRLLECRCRVERGEGSALRGLSAAERSTIVVLDEWRDDAVDAIAAALTDLRNKRGYVDLGVLIPGGRERLIPALVARGVPEQMIQTRLMVDELREGARCSCVVLDEREVRIAGPRTLLASGGWLRLVAAADEALETARAMRSALASLGRHEEFSMWIRQRSTERARRRGAERDALDRPSALNTSLQELIRTTPWTDDDSAASLRGVAGDRVGELEAELTDTRADIERRIATDGGAVCRYLSAPERVETLASAFARTRSGHASGTILFAVRAAGGLIRDPGLIAAVQGALRQGWRLTVAAPPDVAKHLLDTFARGLPAETTALLSARPPLGLDISLFAIRDWVGVSTLDWLDAEVQAPCWAVVIERAGLLQELLR